MSTHPTRPTTISSHKNVSPRRTTHYVEPKVEPFHTFISPKPIDRKKKYTRSPRRSPPVNNHLHKKQQLSSLSFALPHAPTTSVNLLDYLNPPKISRPTTSFSRETKITSKKKIDDSNEPTYFSAEDMKTALVNSLEDAPWQHVTKKSTPLLHTNSQLLSPASLQANKFTNLKLKESLVLRGRKIPKISGTDGKLLKSKTKLLQASNGRFVSSSATSTSTKGERTWKYYINKHINFCPKPFRERVLVFQAEKKIRISNKRNKPVPPFQSNFSCEKTLIVSIIFFFLFSPLFHHC